MQFEEAIVLAKNGKFVQFGQWTNKYVTMVIVNKQVMLLKCSPTKVEPYCPTQKEMLLDDWVEIKRPTTSWISMKNMVTDTYAVAFMYTVRDTHTIKYGIQEITTPDFKDDLENIASLETAIASGLPEAVDELKIVKIEKISGGD